MELKITKATKGYDFRKFMKRSWFDKVTFPHIFLLWMAAIFVFGFVYYQFPTSESFLLYTLDQKVVHSLPDAVYFSFVTATTTGFGDITPHGLFKILSIAEVVMGLLLIAVVTSKLISIKQDIILGELYDISFQERLNRLRSSLILFRQNITNIINDVEQEKATTKKAGDIEVYMSSFQSTLQDISALFSQSKSSEFIKRIDPLNTEILFNSVLSCWERLSDLYTEFEAKKVKWDNEDNTTTVIYCLKSTENLLAQIKKSSTLSSTVIKDLSTHSKHIHQEIKKKIQNT